MENTKNKSISIVVNVTIRLVMTPAFSFLGTFKFILFETSSSYVWRWITRLTCGYMSWTNPYSPKSYLSPKGPSIQYH